ncbi:MAG TPA: phosphoglycerate kinase [Thermoanaerobaculia bacterium]|nr:phosphoglycerate kinase [Thermoanaerobaculia bacterium]
MINIPTVDTLDVRGRRVFCRVDYNVPIENGVISDTTRIDATLPTLRLLRERGARIILAAHFGRPKGQPNPKYSLAPVREKLAEIVGAPVAWAADCIGPDAERAAAALKEGELLLLENLRFHAEEEKNDPEFSKALRKLADLYVNDAFGASHRAHSSIAGLPELFADGEKAAGLLLSRELEFLSKITVAPERPFVAVLGGAKIAGKIEPLEALAAKADSLLIGGGMANTFLAARGVAMGGSLVDRDSLDVAKRILDASKAEVVLPEDLVITDSLDNPTRVETVSASAGVPEGLLAVDIGPRTIEAFTKRIDPARLIFWNGPMGVFEKEQFARGTMAVAEAVAKSVATSVVGGGESVEAVNGSGFADRISHISTGGGASLEFISGETLPGIKALGAGKELAQPSGR